jgi:phage protein D
MTLRTPTAQIVAGSTPFQFNDVTVTQCRTKKGDTFKACGSLTLADLNFWLTTTPIPVTITINGSKVFDGNVDHVDMDFTARTIEISGRDKCAPLHEAQTSEKFLNQQPQQIVQTIASRHGLQCNCDTPSGQAGKQYSTDFDAISNRGSEWSYINRLADHYGMIAYMTGGTLYFKNYNEQLPVHQITYSPPTARGFETGNFIKLKASRNCILGRPIKVNVHSHNHRKKQVISASMTSSGGQGDPLIYSHTVPGITQDQANTIAKAKLAEAQAHELTIDELEFPGDETVNARMSFQLSGTGSPLDQTYDAEQIEHRITFIDGYRTGIKIKNKRSGH